MDAELKALLTQVLEKLEGMEARLKVVEAKAHDQVTPTTFVFQPPPGSAGWPYQQTLQQPMEAISIC